MGDTSASASLLLWASRTSHAQAPETQHLPSDSTEKRIINGHVEHESWELRTETVGMDGEDGDSEVASMQINHTKQLTHYRNLLVRSQTASSSALHDLHAKLHHLEVEHAKLQAEHLRCLERNELYRKEDEIVGPLRQKDGLLDVLRTMSKKERMDILGRIAQSCHPSDIDAQITILEKYKRTTIDILHRLPEALSLSILSLLSVPDVMMIRCVSKAHEKLTRAPNLWFNLCKQLGFDVETALRSEKNDAELHMSWEERFKLLCRRETNWKTGNAQSVTLLQGHTNYVTSLKLHGNTLISGSYDGSIRIWSMTSAMQSEQAPVRPDVLPVKSVSCLDYLPGQDILAVGSHELGRVQVWRKGKEGWVLLHALAGHRHGIRAVAINETWLVSAGADKALVVWDWRTGEKIVRFGQQTNICVGVQLLNDHIVAVTIDGIIRTFSIADREMLAQFRISDLRSEVDPMGEAELKPPAFGVEGAMITWFTAFERHMTCATRQSIIKIEWAVGEVGQLNTPKKRLPTSPAVRTPLRFPAPTFKAINNPQAPTPTKTKTLPITPLKAVPLLRNPSSTSSSSTSPTKSTSPAQSKMRSRRSSMTSYTPGQSISTTPRQPPAMLKHVSAAPRSLKGVITDEKTKSKAEMNKLLPLLDRAPRIVSVLDAPDVERGTTDFGADRVVASTRFASRSGADRNIYIGNYPKAASPMIPISGAWAVEAERLGLQTPEKNPMSLVMDRDRLIYGCADGSVVVVSFVGDRHGV